MRKLYKSVIVLLFAVMFAIPLVGCSNNEVDPNVSKVSEKIAEVETAYNDVYALCESKGFFTLGNEGKEGADFKVKVEAIGTSIKANKDALAEVKSLTDDETNDLIAQNDDILNGLSQIKTIVDSYIAE